MKITNLFIYSLVFWGSFLEARDLIPSDDSWAAVAFSRQSAVTGADPIGRAHGESSEFKAKHMAIRACRSSDCEIKVYVRQGCIGIAKGIDEKKFLPWWGFGAAQWIPVRIGNRVQTVEEAKASAQMAAGEAAKSACDAASLSTNCNITEVFCTWEVEEAFPELTVYDWISDNGGEGSYELRTLVQVINVVSQGTLLNWGLNHGKSSCLVRRRWSRVLQFAEGCGLSVRDLDALLVRVFP